VLVSWIVLAGCGGGAYPRETGSAAHEPPGSVADYEQRIVRMRTELDDSLGSRPSLGQSLTQSAEPMPVPDCAAAADLRDRICELAERICAIAERDAADDDLKAKCESARRACVRAREDVAASCADA
jgi:hypothetical protein